jgi:hypothetical protein
MQAVQIGDDDPGIVERHAVVSDQAGYLAERVVGIRKRWLGVTIAI